MGIGLSASSVSGLRKEWFQQCSPVALVLLTVAWAAVGLYFITAFQEYQHLAPQLAQLENRRGATQMLLVPINGLVIWLMILWSVFFGARSIAQEYEWHTVLLFRVCYGGFLKQIFLKFVVLFGFLMALALPFWVGVGWLAVGTDYDIGLLVGILASQLLIALYASLLALGLSAMLKQGTTAALMCAVLWGGLWIAPILVQSPEDLVAMLQWLSPFAHIGLLTQGQYSVQTLIFIVMSVFYFVSWLMFIEWEG